MEWRVTGVRRWVPLALLLSALVNTALQTLDVADVATGTLGDWVGLGISIVVVVVAAAWTTTAWRGRVRLTDEGVAVRKGRRRLVPYPTIARAYRDRFTSGAISLLLTDGRKVRLPAPVAGLGTPSATVDDALEQIRARLPLADS